MRLRSLDGLRGFAALAVVICHSMVSTQLFFAALYEPIPASRYSLSWWLAQPPFNLVWAGSEAVLVFFVLSGLVVTLPFVGPKSASWLGYYPRRFIRLYVPVWASVGIAIVAAELVHRPELTNPHLVQQYVTKGTSAWLGVHVNPHWHHVKRDLTVYNGTDLLNGPLWSLQWEIWFSALLPLFVAFARIARKAWPQKVVLMLGIITVAYAHHTTQGAWLYLPMFGMGAALAGDLEGVHAVVSRLRQSVWARWAVLVVALALLDAGWIFEPGRFGVSLDHQRLVATIMPSGGALLLVALCLGGPLERACRTPVAQWLGKQSFSLYLVHEPIVVSTALLLNGRGPVAGLVAIAVPLSLLLAWIFQRVVEGPAHDLSKAVGKAASRLPRRAVIEPVAVAQGLPAGVAPGLPSAESLRAH